MRILRSMAVRAPLALQRVHPSIMSSAMHPSMALQAVAKPYVATLDDRFVPGNLLPTGNVGRMVLLVAVLFAGFLVKRTWEDGIDVELEDRRSLFVGWVVSFFGGIATVFRRFIWRIRGLFSPRNDEYEDEDLFEVSKSPDKQRASPARQASSWKTCVLERKDIINDRFMLYKFRMQNAATTFGIGKKVVLCSTDSYGNPIKEDFYPSTLNIGENHFGVLTRIFKRSKDDRLSLLLPTLTHGDEAAYKVGSNIFDYRGPENPIRFMTIVASGVGIVPILELLQRVLTRTDEFNVESVELLWINDSKEDFVFNHAVEHLEAEHPERFFCARVLDQDIGAEDSVLNDKVRDSLPLAETGRVAIVAAPSTIAVKFRSALDSLIYRSDNIMSIAV